MSEPIEEESVPNARSYVVAVFFHAMCLEKGMIARLRCDNAADPIWWCEVAAHNGEWVLALQ